MSEYLCSNPSLCYIGILLSLYTGLRIGKVYALRWQDIHVKEQYLYVHQTMIGYKSKVAEESAPRWLYTAA